MWPARRGHPRVWYLGNEAGEASCGVPHSGEPWAAWGIPHTRADCG